MQADEQRQHHIACAVLFVAVFCGMFFLSLWTPLIADDYNYAFGYANDTRISSLSDIWISMSWHRKLLNPRVFAHGWLSLVLMYPRWVFAALNGAISVFFSWTTIGFFRDQGSRNPIRAAACVWMLLWVCMPGYGQVFLDRGCLQLLLEPRVLVVHSSKRDPIGTVQGKTQYQSLPATAADVCCRSMVGAYLICHADSDVPDFDPAMEGDWPISLRGGGSSAGGLRRLPLSDARTVGKAFPAAA